MQRRIVSFVVILALLSTMLLIMVACNQEIENEQDWIAAFENTFSAENFIVNYTSNYSEYVVKGDDYFETIELEHIKIIYDLPNLKFYCEERYGHEYTTERVISKSEGINKIYIEVVDTEMVVYNYSKNNAAENLWSSTMSVFNTKDEAKEYFIYNCKRYYEKYLNLGLENYFSKFQRNKSGKYTCDMSESQSVTIGFVREKITNYRIEQFSKDDYEDYRTTVSSKITCSIKYSGSVRIPNQVKQSS